MTEGNGKIHKRLLATAACLAMTAAIGPMPGSAYAGDDSGGKGRDGHEREHEKKHTGQGHGMHDARELLDRFGADRALAGPSSGGTSGGGGAGGGSYGSCSRC